MKLVITLDRDAAGHLAVALHALAARTRKQERVFPAALLALQSAAEHVLQADDPLRLVVSDTQEASEAITGTHEQSPEGGNEANRENVSYALTRTDVARLAGVSTATVDRWIANGKLPSIRHGRIRRVRREDLDQFLSRAS